MMGVPSKKRQPTLLVVDDNEVTAMVMVHNLEYLGCRTILTESGEKALEILESDPSVDLVITDLKMTGMDGLELLLRIKQSEVLSDLPVIVCTGSSEEETVKKAVELGCAQYLVKPVHPELLLERVGMVLKKQMPVLEDPGMTQDRLKMNSKAYQALAKKSVDHFEHAVSELTEQLKTENGLLTVDLARLGESAVLIGAERLMNAVEALRVAHGVGAIPAPAGVRLLREMKVLRMELENHLQSQRVETPVEAKT